VCFFLCVGRRDVSTGPRAFPATLDIMF
jgi:hypothetical protein